MIMGFARLFCVLLVTKSKKRFLYARRRGKVNPEKFIQSGCMGVPLRKHTRVYNSFKSEHLIR